MSPLGENRHLQFEQLELRAMLAGNVLVSVVDGDLQVAGDDKDNVLEFQQLSPSNPRALHGGVSFQISPDADTSINGNDPGVGIVVAGVTRDIDVDMGEGGDELVVLGANGHQVRDLLIDAGSGPDAVSITGFKLSRDVRVSSADSLDLSIQRTSAADVFVKIDGIKGEPKDTAVAVPTSSVTIRNSTLRGNVSVSSDVPLAVNIRGNDVGAPFDVCKIPAPPAPFAPCGYVNISSGAPLSLAIDQTSAADVFVKIDDIKGEPKDTAVAVPTSSVTIRNSTLRGNVNVSSHVPLAVKIHGTIVVPIDVCKTPAPPAPFIPSPFPCGNVIISSGAPLSLAIDQTRAADVFVKIDDIQGESKDAAVAPTSSVTIRNSRLRGDANIFSNVPLAVAFDQTTARGEVLIKAEGIPISSDVRSSKFANSIRIVDSVFGSLRIVGSERRDELRLVRLHVLGRSHIETGGGDDSLTVSDTVFGSIAFLDGGDDTDSLILLGTRFRRGSQIVNWE